MGSAMSFFPIFVLINCGKISIIAVLTVWLIFLGNLYLSEDKLKDAVDAIEKGIKKGKLKKIAQAHLTLGQAHYELQNFEEAKKQFRMAARDKDKKIKKTANSWIKYTENEQSRAKNLELRRNYIKQS